MRKKSRGDDGRGCSAGSRRTQFSSDRQPSRRTKRKRKVDPAAERLVHNSIYEKVSGLKDGKKVKLPFIKAFLSSMRKNALAANVSDQIKYLKELINLGVFDFEDYKERLFRGMKNYYREVIATSLKLADFLDELGEAFKRSHILYMFYFTAFEEARNHCTCGACDRGLKYADFLIHLLLKAAFDPDDNDPEDDEPGDDDELGNAADDDDRADTAGLD